MLRVGHSGEAERPGYTIFRDGSALNRSGLVGIIFAHEAVELIKELYPLLSRLERQEILERVVPLRFCNDGNHPEK